MECARREAAPVEASSLEEVAMFYPTEVNLVAGDEPERLPIEVVTPSFFRVFGASPVLGRAFLPEEELGVAVLTNSGRPRDYRRRNTPMTLPRSMVGLKSMARTRMGAILLLAGWKRT